MSTLKSFSVVRSHPGRSCTGAVVGRLVLQRRSRFEGLWRSSGGCLLFGCCSPRFGVVFHADLLEGVRRVPNFCEKTVKDHVQKQDDQQGETEAKPNVNKED